MSSTYDQAPAAHTGPALHRFLVVGCGGSGGATLSYMLDQLRSDLAARGVDRVPDGWQFVHVDVPMAADHGPEGLPNVPQSGGTYIPLGLASGSYRELDGIVTNRVAAHQHLELMGSWAPRAVDKVSVPLTTGAGQLRAVGRMVTLHKATQMREQLRAAWLKLSAANMTQQMMTLQRFGRYDPQRPPIVLVVTSMAGGAGASMALDVCRILSSLPMYNASLAGVFMVGADVFQSLSPAQRTGVMPNALSMFGEIVASQTGEAVTADKGLLEALGLNEVGTRVPFARVFPVNLYQGGNQMTMVGDGSPQAVYRALARGLASLMTSPQATYPFIQYDLTNTVGPAFDQQVFGWGSDTPKQLEWGSFGYASLSMGRDRFAEYAAQRIASKAVGRLVDGHLFEGSQADGLEQLRQRAATLWPHEVAATGLWAGPQSTDANLGGWLSREAWPHQEARATAAGLVQSQLVDFIPAGGNVVAHDWMQRVRQVFAQARPGLQVAIDHAAYTWATHWCDQLLARTQQVVARAVSQHGLAYGQRLVQMLRNHGTTVLQPALRDIVAYAPEPLDTVDQQASAVVDAMRGAVQNVEAIVGQIAAHSEGVVQQHLYLAGCRLLHEILPSYVEDVLGPLETELGARLSELSLAREAQSRTVGVAHVATTSVADWPNEVEAEPAKRWYQATNEVILTTPDQYHAAFTNLVVATAGKPGRYPEALDDIVSSVVPGEWETADGSAPPRDLVVMTRRWLPVALATNPITGETASQAMAGFEVRATPAAVLDRARAFVARRGAPFQTFVSQSLRSYATSPQTVDDIAARFETVLVRALPLAKVDASMVMKLYGHQVSYRYKFSEIPFQGHPLETSLRRVLQGGVDVAQEALQAYDSALTGSQTATRIDVFGSYPCYAPLCFDSVFEPIVQEWNQKKGTFQQGDFWSLRRSRPLPGVLPLTGAERRAMIAGWFLGQVVGRVSIPAPPYSQNVPPATIWVPQLNQWRPFTDVMLTRVHEMVSTADWLPAVLESSLIAMARAHEQPVTESLLPYRALREIFDDDPLGVRQWDLALDGTMPFVGQTLLAEWLRTGSTPPRGVSRVTVDEAAPDPVAARVAGTTAFLDLMEKTSHDFFAPDTGKFGAIGNRQLASQMPVMRDLVDDVLLVLDTLRRVLALAERQLGSGSDKQGPAGFDEMGLM